MKTKQSDNKWLAVSGYQGLYWVTKDGKVKSPKTLKKQALSNKGYCVVELYKDNTRKKMLVHRIVAQTFMPNPNNYPNVCHKDDNPKNNQVTNLFWGTQKMNVKDMMSKGRNANKVFKGEKNGSAKLRDADIPVIRQLLFSTTCAQIAKVFGVDRTAISQIKRGITWTHVR